MRVSCRRDDLRRALHGTLPGAAVRENSILSHVHIEARPKTIILTTYNRQWWMRRALPASTDETGTVVVPARLITEIVDTLASDALDLSTVENDLQLAGLDGELMIRTGFVDMYPQFPQLEVFFTARLDISPLLRAIHLASVAARTTDESQLSGLHLTFSGAELIVAASDGTKLAEDIVPAVSQGKSAEFTVPAVAARQLRELIVGETGPVTASLATAGNLVSFATVNTTLVASTIDGKYPRYRDLVPIDGVIRSRVRRENLLDRLRAALLLAPGEGSRLLVQVLDKDLLVLTGEGSDLGASRLELMASNDAAPAEVFVDGSALKVGLEAMDATMVDLFVGSDRHLVVRPSNGGGELYLVVHKQRPPAADFKV